MLHANLVQWQGWPTNSLNIASSLLYHTTYVWTTVNIYANTDTCRDTPNTYSIHMQSYLQNSFSFKRCQGDQSRLTSRCSAWIATLQENQQLHHHICTFAQSHNIPLPFKWICNPAQAACCAQWILRNGNHLIHVSHINFAMCHSTNNKDCRSCVW